VVIVGWAEPIASFGWRAVTRNLFVGRAEPFVCREGRDIATPLAYRGRLFLRFGCRKQVLLEIRKFVPTLPVAFKNVGQCWVELQVEGPREAHHLGEAEDVVDMPAKLAGFLNPCVMPGPQEDYGILCGYGLL